MNDIDKLRAVFGHPRVERAFAKVLADIQPDVVHFQHLLGLSPNLFWQTVRAQLPTVLTLQDYWYVCANTKLLTNDRELLCQGPNLWLNCARCAAAKLGAGVKWVSPILAPALAARDLTLRRILQRADVIIAPSQFLRDTYVRLGAPVERTRTLAGGVHLPSVRPGPLREHGPLRVLFMGSMLPLKGLHILIEAFNAMPTEAELVIVGDPKRDPDYAQRLYALAQHPGIRWLGPLARAAVWEQFSWADVVAVPSLWYENAPLVIQEALAMRRPVLTSRLGSLSEWVRDVVDGALLPPGDVPALTALLQQLFAHREIIFRWQGNIRPIRTMRDLAQDMEAVYSQVMARRRERRPK
jgi:glycosyltransferase involved in cell wall biosynthesis